MNWTQITKMKKLTILLFLCIAFITNAQTVKKTFKFSTFYAAVNGGTSIRNTDYRNTI